MPTVRLSGLGLLSLVVCVSLACQPNGAQVSVETVEQSPKQSPKQSPSLKRGPANGKVFLESYVSATNAKDMEKRRRLIHPDYLSCMTADNKDYYERYFANEFEKNVFPQDCSGASIQNLAAGEAIPITSGVKGCRVRAQAIAADAPLLLANDFSYPARPTHWLQIEYGDRSKMVQLIQDGGSWFEVIPCPKPETLKMFRERQTKGGK